MRKEAPKKFEEESQTASAGQISKGAEDSTSKTEESLNLLQSKEEPKIGFDFSISPLEHKASGDQVSDNRNNSGVFLVYFLNAFLIHYKQSLTK